MTETQNTRELIVTVCRLLHQRKLIVGPGGNVSARVGDEGIVITPANHLLPEMTEDVLVDVSMGGEYAESGPAPSSECPMHLGLYRKFPEARAVIHAHPPIVLGLSAAGIDFNEGITADMAYYGNRVATVEPLEGGDISDNIFEAGTPIVVVRNHGTFVAGKNLSEAFHLTELLEATAQKAFVAHSMGVKHMIPDKWIAQYAEHRPPTVFRDECLKTLL